MLRTGRRGVEATRNPALAALTLFPRALVLNGTTGAAGSTYSWDERAPTWYVYGPKTDPGAGTSGNPYNPTQARQIARGSTDMVIRWLAGRYDITTERTPSQDRKFPFYHHDSSGISGARIIHQAENTSSTALVGQRTYISRSGGTRGSIFGFYNNDYVIFDGFWCDTDSNPDYGDVTGLFGEYAQNTAWGSTNCGTYRCHFSGSGFSYLGGNHAAIYQEGCTLMDYRDNYVSECGGGTDPGAGNNALFMSYDCDRTTLAYNTWADGDLAIYFKGTHDPEKDRIFGHRIFNNRADDVGAGIVVCSPKNGSTPLANAVWAYKNIITRYQIAMYMRSFNANEPNGVAYVNNTIARAQTRVAGGWYGLSEIGFGTIGTGSAWAELTPGDRLLVFRNNALYDMDVMVHALDKNITSTFDIDRNAYNTFTSMIREGDGGSAYTLTQWQQTPTFHDELAVTANPLFVDSSSDNYELQAGSPLRNAGTDYLNLHGGGTSAAIHIGAYTGVDDVFGRRN